jgi:hypothetical protein
MYNVPIIERKKHLQTQLSNAQIKIENGNNGRPCHLWWFTWAGSQIEAMHVHPLKKY